MSDIDFDELDRAVSGALGGNEAPAPVSAPAPASTPIAAPAPVAETPDVPDAQTINRVERTSLSSVAPGLSAPAAPVTQAATPTPTSTSTAPAARRSSGRFMDMVHPSSDMRSRGLNTAVENRFEKPAQAAPEPVAEVVESPAWNEPLESPFLPDAKVEKRPLGGGDAMSAEANAAVDSFSFDFQGLLDEPEEELLEAPEPQERIEATTMPDPIDFANAADEANAVELVEANPVEIEEPAKVEEAPVEPEIIATQPQPQPVVEASQPVVEEPVGPTSITPQYKEQASSNQESGAMYDTESYHQAVSAPVKKKSGWFTVLWILLLVLVGAGGGWAVYTYVLPML